MNARELVIFRAGIHHAADAALIAAASLETRDDAGAHRQQAAVAALRGLAEVLRAEAGAPDQTAAMMGRIAQNPAAEGEETCPVCAGRVRWIKDASNGHIHARCEAAGCFVAMQ